MVFAKWILCQQTPTRLSENDIKNNTRKDKTRDRIEEQIKSLNEINYSANTLTIIHALKLLQEEDDYKSYIDSDTDSK